MIRSWHVRPLAGRPLVGAIAVPGDKSISHRAVMLNALAGRPGETEVTGLLRSEDVRATLGIASAALSGAVTGEIACDCGNSGTTMRLFMGILAARPGLFILDGDASLRRRPMERVARHLRAMGARIEATDGRPPVRVTGGALRAAAHAIDVASAQVKSALLFAGLFTIGRTTVRMPAASRDHTERMLGHFGVMVETLENGRLVAIEGGQALRPAPVDVPGDISSAAFPLVAALLAPASRVRIAGVGVNPLRTGPLDVLGRSGAPIQAAAERVISAEPRADLEVEAGRFGALAIAGDDVPRLIDEIPVLCLAAAHADAEQSLVRDAKELRVKESDRIESVAEAFRAVGLAIEPTPDGMSVPGRQRVAGGTVESRGDHRIAMTGVVAGLVSRDGVMVRDVACVETSFPGFVDLFRSLGAEIEERTE
jgi:3-phosphoshikimate 1-carboxyvinyltransferase